MVTLHNFCNIPIELWMTAIYRGEAKNPARLPIAASACWD